MSISLHKRSLYPAKAGLNLAVVFVQVHDKQIEVQVTGGRVKVVRKTTAR
jgi:hypothetical protein